MFKKINQLSTDSKLEKNGVRVEIAVKLAAVGDQPEKTINGWLMVRRAGGNNLLFAQVAEAIRKPFKYQYDHDVVPEETKAEHNRQLYADACVANYGGFPDENDLEVPYSKEGARALLETYSVVLDIVRETANKAAQYRLDEHAEAVDQAKNG